MKGFSFLWDFCLYFFQFQCVWWCVIEANMCVRLAIHCCNFDAAFGHWGTKLLFLFVRNLVFYWGTMKYWCYCFYAIRLSHFFEVRSYFLTGYNSLCSMLVWDFGGLWWSWIYNPTLDLSYYEWWYTIRCLGIYISVFEQLCLLFFFSIGLVR